MPTDKDRLATVERALAKLERQHARELSRAILVTGKIRADLIEVIADLSAARAAIINLRQRVTALEAKP